jgi:hypothetical protein
MEYRAQMKHLVKVTRNPKSFLRECRVMIQKLTETLIYFPFLPSSSCINTSYIIILH